MNSQELTAAIREARQIVYDTEGLTNFAKSRTSRQRVSELEQQWKFGFLFDKYPEMHPDELQVIFDQAWEDSHSSSYYEVESKFEDLVAMVKKVLDISRDRA